jgi:hypothetical protein
MPVNVSVMPNVLAGGSFSRTGYQQPKYVMTQPTPAHTQQVVLISSLL